MRHIWKIRATRALLKFCRDHGRSEADDPYVSHIVRTLYFLERCDESNAMTHFKQVPIGGNGCFNDWFPPAVHQNEDEQYALDVFEALVLMWTTAMRSKFL